MPSGSLSPKTAASIYTLQRISLVICVFLWFFQGFSGFGRGQKSLVNLRVLPLGRTPRASCNRTLLRRVLRRVL